MNSSVLYIPSYYLASTTSLSLAPNLGLVVAVASRAPKTASHPRVEAYRAGERHQGCYLERLGPWWLEYMLTAVDGVVWLE
jgi:hypothetical protein